MDRSVPGAAHPGRGGGAEDPPELSDNFPQGRPAAADDGRRRGGHVELPHLLQQHGDCAEVGFLRVMYTGGGWVGFRL